MARIWLSVALCASALSLVVSVGGQPLHAQMLAFSSAQPAESKGKTTRVQTDLARNIESWQDATGCQSPERARRAIEPVVARWLGRQTASRPGQRLAGWGYHSGDIWFENRTLDGRMRCSAGFRKLIAYADFY